MRKENVMLAAWHFSALGKVSQEDRGNPEYDGMNLYKKLIRVEKKLHRLAELECNGEIELDVAEKIWDKQKARVHSLINPKFHKFLHFNGDPRGYVLKFDTKDNKEDGKLFEGMHKDFGGHFILAPDF